MNASESHPDVAVDSTATATPPYVDTPRIDDVPAIRLAAEGQIKFARWYLNSLLETIPHDRFFEIPEGLPTNVAWQIGHLTVSQWGLCMFRLQGRTDEDRELIPSKFRKAYSRGSTPSSDPAKQLPPDQLLQRLDTVYHRSMQVIRQMDPASLLEPIDMPNAVYPNKLGGVLFCPVHEQIHTGQIGMLRRAMQMEPVR